MIPFSTIKTKLKTVTKIVPRITANHTTSKTTKKTYMKLGRQIISLPTNQMNIKVEGSPF